MKSYMYLKEKELKDIKNQLALSLTLCVDSFFDNDQTDEDKYTNLSYWLKIINPLAEQLTNHYEYIKKIEAAIDYFSMRGWGVHETGLKMKMFSPPIDSPYLNWAAEWFEYNDVVVPNWLLDVYDMELNKNE